MRGRDRENESVVQAKAVYANATLGLINLLLWTRMGREEKGEQKKKKM